MKKYLELVIGMQVILFTFILVSFIVKLDDVSSLLTNPKFWECDVYLCLFITLLELVGNSIKK